MRSNVNTAAGTAGIRSPAEQRHRAAGKLERTTGQGSIAAVASSKLHSTTHVAISTCKRHIPTAHHGTADAADRRRARTSRDTERGTKFGGTGSKGHDTRVGGCGCRGNGHPTTPLLASA